MPCGRIWPNLVLWRRKGTKGGFQCHVKEESHYLVSGDLLVEFIEGDLLAPVGGRRFDLVASNPPYVAQGEDVDPEVAQYEPALAVFAFGQKPANYFMALGAPAGLMGLGMQVLFGLIPLFRRGWTAAR